MNIQNLILNNGNKIGFKVLRWLSVVWVLGQGVGCQDGGRGSEALGSRPGVYQAKSGRVELKTSVALDLMGIISRAGIEDVDQLPGLDSRKVSKVVCERTAGPKAKPYCLLYLYDGRSVVPISEDHRKTYSILLQVGGLQATSDPQRIVVAAEDLVCRVFDKGIKSEESEPLCLMSVNPAHPYSVGG